MADNPYEILGVSKTATEKEITSAYRKLAKKFHPDLNPGNKRAEEKFKQISGAHTLLADAEKRKAFDAGQIDMSGQPRQQQFYRDFAEGGARGNRYTSQHFTGDEGGDINDLLSQLFGGRRAKGFGAGMNFGNGQGEAQPRQQHVNYTARIPFMDAVRGGKQRLTMPDGKVFDVNVPAGVEYGQKLRLKGQGERGGDAHIEIFIDPHPVFSRKGNDILVELPVTFYEVVLGSKVQVPTVDGPVNMALPKNASSGATLRLKGKGVAQGKSSVRGDQLVTIKIMLPAEANEKLTAFAQEFADKNAYNPRAAMEKQA